MTIRENLEQWEKDYLSPYASLSVNSKGRLRPEEQCDIRPVFQRDRDRIIHCKAFRRLKDKTQVFLTPEGEHYLTRLTHTLEVSQVARTLARSLRLNEDLTEAAALGHDLGHTPFGHIGESTLNRLLPGGFRHNEQSLRVVEFLEKGGKGLNLTYEVKDGIVNHTGPHLPKTLEGRIVRTADRIAYLPHDYDDSLRAGLLREGDLPAAVYERFGRDTSSMRTSMVSDMIESSAGLTDIRQSDEVRETMDLFRSFMFEHIYLSAALAHERRQAGFMLRQLYAHFLAHPEELPQEFCEREARWGRQQIVTDYVAGLTDSYAVQLFSEIFIPPVGRVIRYSR